MILDDIKNPPKKYRPIPFWSWNEKLDTNETARQIGIMDDIGIGGYFMHARGGLQTEFMGEEWFENIAVGIDEAEKRGMYAWAYDENGWPSGFGNGVINGMGDKYRLKYLRMEKGERHTEHTICNNDGYHFYYEVNPFYVDNMDKDVVKEFIERIYQPYYDKFKDRLTGVFTDEPQLSRNGIPWSFVLPDEYKKAYNEDLLPKLIQLFRPVGDYEETRLKFWRLVTKLFSDSYSKQIYEWCGKHGLKLTGHMVSEDTMNSQLTANGSVMAHYEYYHIPAMDWLGRRIFAPLTQLAVSSVAHQTGKKQVMTETFALCGHNVSFGELRWILEWQMARGINLFCPHLEGYSLRGIRKRDYPPAMYYQQPWWKHYKIFVDSMTRIGMLLAEGSVEFDTLMIHPQSTAWVCYDDGENKELDEYDDKLKEAIQTLEQKHVLFHLGDETVMEKHARVEGDRLIIGEQKYSTVVLPPHKVLFENTKRLLEEFKTAGGKIITPEQAEDTGVIDNENITYTKRIFDEFDMHYFVNTTKETQKSKIFVGNARLDIISGEVEGFDGEYTFAPMDSIVVFDFKNKNYAVKPEKKLKNLKVDGEWRVEKCDENAMVLDYCDCYFDGELVRKNVQINAVQGMACDRKEPVDIRCVYKFDVAQIPENISLVSETPDIFEYSINGKPFSFEDKGFYRDIAFRKSRNIAEFLKKGENVIEVKCHFVQSDEVYENIEKSLIFESEKNKLTYDMEIEAMYLVGDFSVRTDGEFEQLDKDAVRYSDGFVIDAPCREAELENIEQQGYPFFAGSITLSKEIVIDETDFKILFDMKGINAVDLKVNGKSLGSVIWSPMEFDLSSVLEKGENTIEMTLTNNLRNLLGPHHLQEGESYSVGPASFFTENSVWRRGGPIESNDGYCFVETSLKIL